jgi:hypothetical protein
VLNRQNTQKKAYNTFVKVFDGKKHIQHESGVVYHFKLGKFEQQLFGANILKLNGRLCIVACTFDAKNLTTSETVVEDIFANGKGVDC